MFCVKFWHRAFVQRGAATAAIPPLTGNGVLSRADWEASLDQLRASILMKVLDATAYAYCDPAERRPYRGYPKRQLPMWHRYRVEFYPHYRGLIAGRDHRGNSLEFPSWFRLARRPLPGGQDEKRS